MHNEPVISQSLIENRIFTIRGMQVMIDYHLAEIYNVQTKRLNEQVKRNNKRFPQNFMFQLSINEWEILQSQIATANIKVFCIFQIRTATPFKFIYSNK